LGLHPPYLTPVEWLERRFTCDLSGGAVTGPQDANWPHNRFDPGAAPVVSRPDGFRGRSVLPKAPRGASGRLHVLRHGNCAMVASPTTTLSRGPILDFRGRLSSALQSLEARGRGLSPLGDVKRQLHASAARLSSLAGRRVWRPTCGVLAAPAHGHNAG